MENKCEKRCIDCIHFDMCAELHAYYKGVGKERVIAVMSDGHSDKLDCGHYKAKSLCVELPCKCKDCKHWCENYKDDILGIRYGRCKNYKSPYRYEEDNVTENDYCSYGERKLEVGE